MTRTVVAYCTYSYYPEIGYWIDEAMKIKPLGISNKFFYYKNSGEFSTFSVRIKIHFKVPVDRTSLVKSIENALKIHSWLAIRPIIKENSLYFIHNTNSIICFDNIVSGHYMGTDETNGYLFCTYLLGNDVILSFFHGVTDYNGMLKFVVTLLYFYGVELGIDLYDVEEEFINKISNINYDWQELYDPYMKFMPIEEDVKDNEWNFDTFSIPEKKHIGPSNYTHGYVLTTDNLDVYRTVKKINTRFSIFLGIIIASAIDDVYDVGEKCIKFMLPVDMRKIYNTETTANFSEGMLLPLEYQTRNAEIHEQCKKLSIHMDAQMQKEYFDKIIIKKIHKVRRLETSCKDSSELQMNLLGSTHPKKKSTFVFSYLGKQIIPQALHTIIEGIYPDFWHPSVGILGYASKDELKLQFRQRFDSDAIVQSCKKRLKKFGVKSEVEDQGYLCGDKLVLSKLDRI